MKRQPPVMRPAERKTMLDWLRKQFRPEITFGELIDTYMASAEFRALAPATQQKGSWLYPRLKRHFGADRRLTKISYDDAQQLVSQYSDRPGLANAMLNLFRARMRDAHRRGLIARDPTEGIKRLPIGTFHTWTESEIEQFERRWPRASLEILVYAKPFERVSYIVRGGVARLAFDLFLWTDQRRSDVARMAWSDLTSDRLFVKQQKTGTELSIPRHRNLQAALEGFERGNGTILKNGNGNAFSPNDLGNMMRAAIRAAGLPSRCKPHGLRKAFLRRIAERGGTAHMLQSISGHKDLREVADYTRAVDQARMADAAFALFEEEIDDDHRSY